MTVAVASSQDVSAGSSSSSRPRVLIVAEHASARFGGEAILPLHYFRGLRARGGDVWMIVHERTRHELTLLLKDDIARVHFLTDTRTTRFLHNIGGRLHPAMRNVTTGLLARLLMQRQARKVASELVRSLGIDVVHQPIPVSPRECSLLYDLGAAVVIGPMNGGMTTAPGLEEKTGLLTKIGRSAYGVARFVSNVVHRMAPGKLRAETLLVANERTAKALPSGIRGEVRTVVENGVDLSLWKPAVDRASSATMRFAFVGRLVDWKGVDLLLDAVAEARKSCDVSLDIIGRGPVLPALEQQTEKLGLKEHVKFLGWMNQSDCAARLRESGALVLPSLHECGGAVVLEAMACALPVIATDWGGPADYLDTSCGILVPPTSRKAFIICLADAMRALANDPARRATLGVAARAKVEREYDWARKIDQIYDVYADAIARHRAAKGGRS